MHDHVARFKNWVDKENRKICAFTFQNTCFPRPDIGKHVLWHHVLYWGWEEDGCPANCQKSLRCRSSSRGRAMKFSKVPKFFSEKKCKKETKRCLLWIDTARAKDKRYIWVSVWWKKTVRFYYESIKREPKIKSIYEYRCDERLQTKSKEFTRLPYTGLVLELEHLKIEPRFMKDYKLKQRNCCLLWIDKARAKDKRYK